ncbi:hypothetical protein SUGI_1181950 [Cryptomeria japonica]|uniref:patellin-4 n=1 Tax=Cryptomeria japonica TaxID=3369 RepID=UPI002414813D|nr:patellin-4 [Cryptomeria japonica]GLJ55065.1 hypothetical protein SUGI_1181950 [Cryptomeria japonica]
MAATAESAPVTLPVPDPAPVTEEVVVVEAAVTEEPAEEVKTAVAAEAPKDTSLQFASFKEESNFVADLKEPEKKALQELKVRVEEAIKNNEFVEPPPKEETAAESKGEAAEEPKEEVKIVTAETSVAEEVSETKVSAETEIPPAPEAPAAAVETEEPKPAVEVAEVKIAEAEEEVKPAEAGEEVRPAEAGEEVKPVPEAGDEVKPVPEGEIPPAEVEPAAEEAVIAEEVYLWGVPLLPSKGDERTDVVLLKFLRARDFKVSDAFTMLKNTILWRKKFGADSILEEEFGNELDGVAYMHGFDKEGHPVCYNFYGVFEDKELYNKTFGDDVKRDKFLRWRVQFLEKGIRQLSFSPGGINSMVQITDFKNSPGLGKWEHRQATKKAVALLQDNYPEFVAKKVFINVPWWYLALNTMISPFVTQRTKSKFVVARAARVSETLFKYISPEHVPVQYGGLSRENDEEFNAADGGVSEQIVKAGTKHIVEIPTTEVGSTLVWDLVVSGWEVSYGAEFVPSAESGYTVIIQKARKFAPNEEPVRQSFKIGEPGKVALTVDNTSSKRKKILYRSKVKTA